MKLKEWYRIILFYDSSYKPLRVIERRYSSYGRARAAADKYAKHYACNYTLKQLSHYNTDKFIP